MIAFAGLVLALCAFAPQGSSGIPKNDGWVTDLAGMLPAARESALETRMESYRAGSSGAEIAVLTVPSLRGEPVERFALETSRAWGIGSKATSNGALLVVARDERAVRIEVGRGLEGEVPDAIAARIINQVIVPRFQSGDFAGGIESGISALHEAIGGNYAAIGGRAERAPGAGRGLAMLILMFVIFAAVSARRRGQGPRGRGPFGGLGLPLSLGGFGGLGSSGGGGFSGGGFGGFGGGGGFSGGGASGRW